MSESFSSLKMYEHCPRQYHEVRVLKRFPRQDTEATLWGKVVHEAAEHYVRDGKPIEIEVPGKDMIEAVAKLKGEKFCELEMAVNDKLEAVAFDSLDAVLRGIADVVIINGAKARIIDWKTGGAKYPDASQLELMALMVFAKFPDVQISRGALLFLAHNHMEQKITKRVDAQRLWANWFGKLERIDQAHETSVWNPKSSGLCPWCPVVECEHWRQKR